MKNLGVLSCIVCSKAGYQSVRKADDQYHSHRANIDVKQVLQRLGAAPHVSTICQPARDQISQASPAIFLTGSDQILAVETRLAISPLSPLNAETREYTHTSSCILSSCRSETVPSAPTPRWWSFRESLSARVDTRS